MTQKSREERVALFAGSFAPFTTGHLDILKRGLEIFDRVIVVKGVNCNKESKAAALKQNLQAIIDKLPGAELMEWDGLTVDAARETGARYLLRGARSVADFEYERNLADMNRKISGIETVVLISRPELSAVSSSVVRELASFGHDVKEFLP